jgi:1-acyl-sn-glycerol-3-phosphate acyltransferase
MSQYSKNDPRALRKGWLISIGTSAISGIFQELYQMSYKNVDRLEQVRDRPFFLISNHQSSFDIPLAEIPVKDALNRYLFFVMKASLHSFMRYLGGIDVTRVPDIKEMMMEAKDFESPEQKKGIKELFVRSARRARNLLYEKTLPELIASGEAVVIYPEGSRVHGTTLIDTGFPRENLAKMLEVQERAQSLEGPSFRVPFLPFYIQYLPSRAPGSKIVIDVGEPRTFENDDIKGLCKHLVDNIGSFRLAHP